MTQYRGYDDVDTISGLRRLLYYADIGAYPISGIPDIGAQPISGKHDIGCAPISGIIEISTDIDVNIAIYRHRNIIRRYRCLSRIQMIFKVIWNPSPAYLAYFVIRRYMPTIMPSYDEPDPSYDMLSHMTGLARNMQIQDFHVVI